MKNKGYALQRLLEKQNDISITYEMISRETGYSERQLIRLAKELKEKDIKSLVTHGNTGVKPVTTASDQEISYICELKKLYPNITIAQFRDIFIEDVILNPEKQEDVQEYNLKPRSKSWFRDLFQKEGWKSPVYKPARVRGNVVIHTIRKPRPCMGELVQIDGTPFDWFGDGRDYTLHLAIDDATTTALAGWFMPTECTRGYCRMMNEIMHKYGIPDALYSDRDSVFIAAKGKGESQFAQMMHKLNIETIYANSAEAKGRVERYNGTIQNRLPNDIIRFKVPHDYDELNRWLNDFYLPYMNKKFSFLPLDPNDHFRIVSESFDYSDLFRVCYPRQIRNNSFSMGMKLYSPTNENGEVIPIKSGTKVTVFIDVFTEEMYIEYYGIKRLCYPV